MKTATTFSSGFVTCLAAVSIACGGGGGGSGDGYTPAEGELAPWEWEAGTCSFDNQAAKEQAEREGSQCLVSMIGNTSNDQPWPPVSWPSTPVLWRAR